MVKSPTLKGYTLFQPCAPNLRRSTYDSVEVTQGKENALEFSFSSTHLHRILRSNIIVIILLKYHIIKCCKTGFKQLKLKHKNPTKIKMISYLVEIIESFMKISKHSSRRFVCNLNGRFQNSLWNDVRISCSRRFCADEDTIVLVPRQAVFLQVLLQCTQPFRHQMDILCKIWTVALSALVSC